MSEIEIPFGFTPRSYQLPLMEAIDNGIKRACAFWHRRAGKDKCFINILAKEAHKRIGTYFYFFPTFKQGKRVIWEGRDKDGFRFLDHIPRELVARKNENDMRLELTCGSAIQIIGTDNFDDIRGANPIGCIFSEFAYQNPKAWNIVRPILNENGGWAIFNTTPNGKNHAYHMYKMARVNKVWFCQLLTIEDTKVIPLSAIEEERNSGMEEDMLMQEYYCSFDAGVQGSYYSAQMQQCWNEQRIVELPFYQDRNIDIYFDIGVRDATAMWFGQADGEFYNFLNYFEKSNQNFEYFQTYIDDYLRNKKGTLGTIYMPHDANQRDWGTGKTPLQLMQTRFGQEHVKMIEIGSIDTGINAVKAVLSNCRFDKKNCEGGINCLENYGREWDEVAKVFKQKPKHDWSSHGADAFRGFAISYRSVQHDTVKPVGMIDDDKKYKKEFEDMLKEDTDIDL